MDTVLGLSAFYHDSAACLVRGGHILSAAQEERFSRLAGDDAIPVAATAACLAHAELEPHNVDLVVYYEKPLLRLERVIENHLQVAPRGFWQWKVMARRLWREKLFVERTLRTMLPGFTGEFGYVEHHEAHAASAFLPSPFSESAILTVDGIGEWTTAAWGVGRGSEIAIHEQMSWPHSLGLVYSAVTSALGFRVNRDEYKVMGLAAYGTPRFVDWIDTFLLKRHADGSCTMRTGLLSYRSSDRMVSNDFEHVLGFQLRTADGSLTDAARDLAASLQRVLELQLLAMADYVARQTGLRALCLAGGVAYNCVANGRLRREGLFSDIWIQPAAGDAGGSVGAAMLGWHRSNPSAQRIPQVPDGMQGSLLGPTISASNAERASRSYGLEIQFNKLEQSLDAVADELAAGQIVAIAHGRMEFGPRALGNRSILADPRVPGIQNTLNSLVKHRESFRPFAPAVLEEYTSEVFATSSPSPYMLEAVHVRCLGDGASEDWRSLIAGAVHVDGTARLQTVDRNHPGVLRSILERFHSRTGCPVLINTSFNDADMPIVASAADACRAMRATDLQCLLLGDLFVRTTVSMGSESATEVSAVRNVTRSIVSRAAMVVTFVKQCIGDALLFLIFLLVVCPFSLAYRLTQSRATSTTDDTSWRPSSRLPSRLSKPF